MKKEETNVFALVLLLIALTLEISFYPINVAQLCYCRRSTCLPHLSKEMVGHFLTLLLPLLPALANYWAIQLHGDNSRGANDTVLLQSLL